MNLALARVRVSKVAALLRRPRLWRGAYVGLRHGVYPSLEHAPVPFAADFATVLDVGASRGQFAVFARARFPGARIISFEPLPDAQDTAARVLAGLHGELHRVALGASAGETTLHVSAQDDSSSLLPIGPEQVRAFPGTQEARKVSVQVDVLSSYLTDDLSRPCLLKIDVQGLELDVLRGAGDRLALVDEVFVEASFVPLYTGQALVGEVVAFLADRGLRLVDVIGVARRADGVALQADFLFRRAV